MMAFVVKSQLHHATRFTRNISYIQTAFIGGFYCLDFSKENFQTEPLPTILFGEMFLIGMIWGGIDMIS